MIRSLLNSDCASLKIFIISEVIYSLSLSYIFSLLTVQSAFLKCELFLLPPQRQMSGNFFLVVGIRQHVTFQKLEPLRSKRTTYLIFHLKLFHDSGIAIFNPSVEALYIFLGG